jgi:hypothetical protein
VFDDAQHVRELVGERSVILVGHSYSGAVITEAAAEIPHIEHLVPRRSDARSGRIDVRLAREAPHARHSDDLPRRRNLCARFHRCRAGSVTEIDTEHQVILSHPEAVAAMIAGLLPT